MIWNTVLTLMHAVGLASCAALLLWFVPSVALHLKTRVQRALEARNRRVAAPTGRLAAAGTRPARAESFAEELKRFWKHLARFCDSAITH